MGEKSLKIIYEVLDKTKQKYKKVNNVEKNGFNSKILFKPKTKQNEKNEILSFFAKNCYEEFNKQVGNIAKPMVDFVISNYKQIKF